MKPKLTLRDLFWLVLVCAMGCGWWGTYRHLQKEALTFRSQFRELEKHATEKEAALDFAARRRGFYFVWTLKENQPPQVAIEGRGLTQDPYRPTMSPTPPQASRKRTLQKNSDR